MHNRVYANMVNSKLVHRIIGRFHSFYATGSIQTPNRTKNRTLICLRAVDKQRRLIFMNQLGYRDMHVITLANDANENIFNSLVGFCRMFRDPIIHPTVITGIYLEEMTRASSELNALIESLQK